MTGADAAPINNFVNWFQVITADMNAEVQKRVLAASRKAASSVFTDIGDDETSLIVVPAPQVQGDVRRVKYSAEITELGFPLKNRSQGLSPKEWQIELNKLWPTERQEDLRLPPLKHSQSHS